MSLRVDLNADQGSAASGFADAGDSLPDTVDAAREADAAEDAVTGRAMRMLQLHDDARGHADAAEQKLASVRDDFDRLLAGHIDREAIAEPAAVEAATVPALPQRGRRSFAVLAVLVIASVAVTAGLVVSLNAATTSRDAIVATPQTSAMPVTGDEPGPSRPSQVGREDLGSTIYASRFVNAPASERACLARAVYYEARGEAMDGQIAVAQVVLNRVRSKKWPSTICGVVHQGIERGEKCQFSFACFSNLTAPHGETWVQAQMVAEQAVNGQAWLRELAEATYYHTTDVAPAWRTSLTPIATIGSHIFYRDGVGLQASEPDEGKYQAAVATAPGAQAADAARAKAAAAAKARAKVAGGAENQPSRRAAGGSSDDWTSSVFSR